MNPRTLRPGKTGFNPKSISGLVAYWPLSEAAETSNVTALDASGSGLNLTSTGALSEPGRDGYGRLLSVAGSQWNPSPARLSRGTQNATPEWNANATGWSVAFWVRTDLAYNSTGTSSTAANIVFESTAGGNMQNVRFSGGTPALGFQSLSTRCYFSDGSFAGGILTGPMTDTTPQGQWTHMAFVANPSALSYTVYRNGTVFQSYSYASGKVLADFSSGIACTIQWPGTIDEIVVYNRTLTASEVGRLAGIPSRPAAASTLHPDCRSWISRVLAAGGSVSSTTAAAVSQFCNAIDAAGIRNKFYRLNLFCGTSDASLNAVRTPLYLGPSLSGAIYGNTTDTNVNFVAGDYAETGASGGLTGNGSTKSLQTGIRPDQMPTGFESNVHLAAYRRTAGNGQALLGSYYFHTSIATDKHNYELALDGGVLGRESGAQVPVGSSYPRFTLATRSSSSSMFAYANGTAGMENSNALAVAAFGIPFTVFARNLVTGAPPTAGSYGATFHTTSTLGGYSIGASMSPAQVSAYTAAMQAFQAALSRNV